MTVNDWPQSIYLLTDSQLVRGNAVTARRENRGSERVDGWRVRGLEIKKKGVCWGEGSGEERGQEWIESER